MKNFWYEDDRDEEDQRLIRGLEHVKVKQEPYIPKEKVTSEHVIMKTGREKKLHKLLVK